MDMQCLCYQIIQTWFRIDTSKSARCWRRLQESSSWSDVWWCSQR